MSHLKNIEILRNLFLTFHIAMGYSLFLGEFEIVMEGNVFNHSSICKYNFYGDPI